MPPMLVSFSLDERGKVSKISAQLEQGVKDIVFTRIPDYMENSLSYEKYTGDYEMQGITVKVSIKSNKLKLLVPGQPEYELAQTKENSFDIKEIKAYSVIFNTDDSGKIIELQFNKPNGVFKAKKK